jgi:putative ABC transport system permease protein
MMPPRPPALLVALLQRISSRAAANAAVGDLFEELHALGSSDQAPAMPRVWLAARIVRAIVAASMAALPRIARTCALVARDAWRSVRRAPMHSLSVMAILALGISVGTLTFSVVDAVLLKPLPLDHPEELVSIPSTNFPARPFKLLTPQQYLDFRDRTHTLTGVAALLNWSGGEATVAGVTRFLDVTYATADAFDVLRLKTEIGRLWTREEEARGQLDGAVLGYAFWRQQFNRDPSVLGKPVVVGKRSYQVIGVLTASTDAPEFGLISAPIWIPQSLNRTTPAESRVGGIVGRLRPGVSADAVATELQDIAGLDWRPGVASLSGSYLRSVRSWLLLALGATALVVLIACVNAANLLLARSAHRSQETAIRSSLGASRRRVALSMLVEGVILSGGATAVALIIAIWGVSAARTMFTTMVMGLFRAQAIALNSRVLVAAIAAAVVTGVLCAVIPAWQMSRASVVDLLKDGGPGATRGGRRWRSAFLVAEMASVCVLVVMAWMFVASLIKVVGIDLGVGLRHQLAVNPRMEFKGPVDQVKARIEQIPGVAGVAMSTRSSLPVFAQASSGAWSTTALRTVGGATAPVEVLDYRVSQNFFDVASVTFRRGSAWARDVDPVTDVPVVLDELAARQLFGDTDPIGRQVTTTDLPGVHTVVGIVPHVRARGPEVDVPPSAFFPIKPNPARMFAGLLVRTSGPPAPLVPVITKALEAFAPNQPEPYVFAANEAMERLTRTRRFNAWLMSSFGIAGLLIGAAGIFAVMASMVAQQTREIGIRMALGATTSTIARDVLATAARHVGLGLAIGLPAAWWCSRGFAALLFRVTPTDLGVYTGVAVLLAFVGFVAALVPARRASRVDPVVSLRV